MTGETTRIDAKSGDHVYAGTLNGDQALTICVSACGR